MDRKLCDEIVALAWMIRKLERCCWVDQIKSLLPDGSEWENCYSIIYDAENQGIKMLECRLVQVLRENRLRFNKSHRSYEEIARRLREQAMFNNKRTLSKLVRKMMMK